MYFLYVSHGLNEPIFSRVYFGDLKFINESFDFYLNKIGRDVWSILMLKIESPNFSFDDSYIGSVSQHSSVVRLAFEPCQEVDFNWVENGVENEYTPEMLQADTLRRIEEERRMRYQKAMFDTAGAEYHTPRIVGIGENL